MAATSMLSWPTAAALKAQFIADVQLQAIAAGVQQPPAGKGTDLDLQATAATNLTMVALSNQSILDADSDWTRAEGDQLDEIRIRLGLPEVLSTGSTGSISGKSVGTVVVPAGLRFALGNGKRGEAVASVTGSGSLTVTVAMLDVGSDTNADAGALVQWVAPPTSLLTDATVVVLSGGTDNESDAQKRIRIGNRLSSPVGAGNWAQCREVALNVGGVIADAYVYPCLGGPSSARVVLLRAGTKANLWTRTVTSTETDAVSAALVTEVDTKGHLYSVVSVAEQTSDVSIGLTLPSGGWSDPAPWPANAVYVSTVTTETSFRVERVGAATWTAPVGDEAIAVWYPAAKAFRRGVVSSSTPGTNLADLVVVWSDSAPSGSPTAGSWVSPAANSLNDYADAFLGAVAALGPGENLDLAAAISAGDIRATRANREPVVGASTAAPMTIGSTQVGAIQDAFPTVQSAEYLSRSVSTPTVPATVATAPNVLVIGQLSFLPVTP